ncbi:MAG: hypothetical protein ACRDWD_07945 [Acidimicrobiia bacterium]
MTESPAPPAGPPPGWDIEQRPRRRRRWVWVLVSMCAVIALLFGAGIGLFVTRQKPVIDAANAFLDDVAAGRFETAYDDLCVGDRDSFSEEEFASFASSEPTLARLDEPTVNFLGIDVNGDRATVDFDPEGNDSDDFDDNFELELRKEDGDWRVCGLASSLS